MTFAETVYETPLPKGEFDRRLDEALRALDGPEGTDLLDLLAWFSRRYPTPLARLRYARRKYSEAMGVQALALAQQIGNIDAPRR